MSVKQNKHKHEYYRSAANIEIRKEENIQAVRKKAGRS
jgi:hypothetical protein